MRRTPKFVLLFHILLFFQELCSTIHNVVVSEAWFSGFDLHLFLIPVFALMTPVNYFQLTIPRAVKTVLLSE